MGRRDRTPGPVAHFQRADAPGRMPGVRWIAELVDGEGECTVPYAVAWLSDFRNTPVKLGMILDYIIVPDHFRRKGLAMELIRACKQRWPDLHLTDAISPEGEAMVDAWDREESEATPS